MGTRQMDLGNETCQKTQVIQKLALQRALGGCSAEAPLLAARRGRRSFSHREGGKPGGTLWKHHGSQELLIGKVFLIIAESRVAGKGTGTASHPNLPALCHLYKGMLSWVERALRKDPAL